MMLSNPITYLLDFFEFSYVIQNNARLSCVVSYVIDLHFAASTAYCILQPSGHRLCNMTPLYLKNSGHKRLPSSTASRKHLIKARVTPAPYTSSGFRTALKSTIPAAQTSAQSRGWWRKRRCRSPFPTAWWRTQLPRMRRGQSSTDSFPSL